MKILEFNTYDEAVSFCEEINSLFKDTYKGATNTFTNPIKHPTLNKWGTPMEMKFVDRMIAAYPERIAQLSKGVQDLVEMTPDWINNTDIL